MTEIFTIVECKVTFNDGSIEMKRPTFAEVSVGLASMDKISVINYLRENLKSVSKIEVIDTLYFRNKEEFEKYLNSI